VTARREPPVIQLLVTDLDNTLWDWFTAWHRSFSSMLASLEELSGVPASALEKETKTVHQRRKTTEYSMLLNELPSLKAISGSLAPLKVFDEAIHVLNSERLRATALYPGVKSTLEILKRGSVPVVAYSESLAYWTEWRIRKTGLDGLIDVLYTSPDHDLPADVSIEDIRTLPPDDYGLRSTEHRHVPRGIIKPNPVVLHEILEDYGIDARSVAYVGDSLMKDVAMAKDVGVHDVHAAYGVVQHKEEYSLLRRVSHWSQEDVERERRLVEQPAIQATHELHHGFGELLQFFQFEAASR